jgi:SAM-dependent methyltransferase
MAQRKAGALIKYKEYANNVKRRMVKQYAAKVGLLLDLGCGRGGDLSKWRDAGVAHVVAMDLSAEQLEDALRREHDGGKGGKRAAARAAARAVARAAAGARAGARAAAGSREGGTRISWLQGSLLDASLEKSLRAHLSSDDGHARAPMREVLFESFTQWCYRSGRPGSGSWRIVHFSPEYIS